MTDSTDPTVNPQADRPGEVQPQRTPGTAPSVVPLPAGADPDNPDAHPLPEEAIEGYPHVADLYEGEPGAPDSSPAQPQAGPALDAPEVSDQPAKPAAGKQSGAKPTK